MISVRQRMHRLDRPVAIVIGSGAVERDADAREIARPHESAQRRRAVGEVMQRRVDAGLAEHSRAYGRSSRSAISVNGSAASSAFAKCV